MGEHESVLLNEVIDGLDIKEDGIYVDCTLGRAGHALEIAKRLGEQGKMIGFDQDIDAMEAASKKLNKYHPLLIHSNFRNLKVELTKHRIHNVNGFLFDLGVSSPQLDEAERGFSY